MRLRLMILMLALPVLAFGQRATRHPWGIRADSVIAFSDSSVLYFSGDSLWYKRCATCGPINILRIMGTGVGDMLKSVYDTNDNGLVDTVEHAPASGSVDSVRAAYQAHRILSSEVVGLTDSLGKRILYTDTLTAAWVSRHVLDSLLALRPSWSDTLAQVATHFWVTTRGYLTSETGDITEVNTVFPLTGGDNSGPITVGLDTAFMAPRYWVKDTMQAKNDTLLWDATKTDILNGRHRVSASGYEPMTDSTRFIAGGGIGLSQSVNTITITNTGTYPTPREKFELLEDFGQGLPGWTTTLSSGVITNNWGGSTDSMHSGMCQFTTGTTTTGRSTLTGHTSLMNASGGVITFESAFSIPDTLSSSTNTYKLRLGLGDTQTDTLPTDGIWIQYTSLSPLSQGLWGYSRSSGTRDSISLGQTVSQDVFYRVGFQTDATGTRVDFYVNGTLKASITNTNAIPRSIARLSGPLMQIFRAGGSGTGTRRMIVDYYWLKKVFTVQR